MVDAGADTAFSVMYTFGGEGYDEERYAHAREVVEAVLAVCEPLLRAEWEAERVSHVGPRDLADQLADALRTHRADMHNTSNRPCNTCRKSAKALADYDAAIRDEGN